MARKSPSSDKRTKKKDKFFTKPRQKFQPNKGGKFDRTNSLLSKGEDSFKPSVSGSDDFFVKPIDKVLTKKPLTKRLQDQDPIPAPQRFKHSKEDRNKKKFDRDKNEGDVEHFGPSPNGGDDFFAKSIGDIQIQGEISFRKRYPSQLTTKAVENEVALKPEKKTFDKKRYRLQKYSKKYKLDQWEQKRKAAVLRGYYRSVKDDEPKFDVKTIYEQYQNEIDSETDHVDDKVDEENENNLNASINNANTEEEEPAPSRNSKEKKNRAFKKAQLEFKRIREEKQKKKEDMLKRKAEMEEALQAYKKKKAEKFKKLSRKTKHGQPIMKERMEMLLEKIQNSMK